MKVLDVILEGATGEAGEYVWKFLAKQTPQAVFGREVARDVAQQIFNTYTKQGVIAPRAELDKLLDSKLSRSEWKNDIAFAEQVERETVSYHNALYKEWSKKGRTKVKPKDEPDAPAVLPAHIRNQALKARSSWKSLTAKGLWEKALYAWQFADIYEAVNLYWEQMDWALGKLAIGPDAIDPEDGKKGYSLESFHHYHKEVLAVLFAQLVATFPSAWNKVPVLGWASAIVSNKVTGLAGKTLWLTFLDAHKFGGGNDLSIRNFIDNFMMWQLKAIPIVGPLLFGDKVTIASVIGQPLVWTEDLIKGEWVKFLKATAYKDSDIPAGLLPDNYPNPNNPADAEAEKKKQAAKVVNPADADSQSDTNPSKTDSSGKRPGNKNPNGDWEDMGNGFEVNRMNNHVRVKRY